MTDLLPQLLPLWLIHLPARHYTWPIPTAFPRSSGLCCCHRSYLPWKPSEWEPFERNNQVDFAAPGWAYRVAQADVRDVEQADGIFAVVNGTPPDEGVMVELGIAIALKKPIFLFRDDFRRCTDSEEYPLNLMLFASLPEVGWQDYFYDSVTEIGDRSKPMAVWLHA
jgi:Nucleoside 2-deoxyribosyltransferase